LLVIFATITPPPMLFAADTPLFFRQLPLPFSYDAGHYAIIADYCHYLWLSGHYFAAPLD
jgi:hypothetical protein